MSEREQNRLLQKIVGYLGYLDRRIDDAFANIVKTSGTGGVGGQTLYGAGIDGAIVLNGTTQFLFATLSGSIYTLTRNVWATNLTINAGITLKLAGFAIICNGTLQNDGTIHSDGNDASGSTAGTGSGGGYFLGGTNGGAGIASGGAAGPGAIAVQPGTASYVGNMGGRGAAAWVNAVTQLGATCSTTIFSNFFPGYSIGGWRITQNIFTYLNLITPISASGNRFWTPGIGGGSGAKSAVGVGCNSGGGGGGGGFAVLRAKTIINTGTIRAAGGKGGDAAGTGANAGGGGGGSGGVIALIYDTLTNTGTISAPGGAGGTSVAGGTTPVRAVARTFANSSIGASVTKLTASPNIAPSKNTLYLAWVHMNGGTLNTPTLTGFGLTWNLITTKDFNTIATPTSRLCLWYAYGTPVVDGDNASVFAEFSSAPTSSQLCIAEIQNASSTIVQNATNSTNSATTLTCTLAALGGTNAAVFAVFAFAAGTTRVAGAGFTIISDFTSAPQSTGEMSYNDTTADISWTTAAAAAGIAIEIQAVGSMENGQDGLAGVIIQIPNK